MALRTIPWAVRRSAKIPGSQQLYLLGVKTAQHGRFLQFLIRRQKDPALREVFTPERRCPVLVFRTFL
jgi:hypothetical protein